MIKGNPNRQIHFGWTSFSLKPYLTLSCLSCPLLWSLRDWRVNWSCKQADQGIFVVKLTKVVWMCSRSSLEPRPLMWISGSGTEFLRLWSTLIIGRLGSYFYCTSGNWSRRLVSQWQSQISNRVQTKWLSPMTWPWRWSRMRFFLRFFWYIVNCTYKLL